MSGNRPIFARRRQRSRRLPIALAVLVVVFALGAIAGASGSNSEQQQLAERWASEWTHGQYSEMYGQIDTAARAAVSPAAFAADYRGALVAATARSVSLAGAPRNGPDGTIEIPMRIKTRMFGTLHETLHLPFHDEGGVETVAWTSSLDFPGLAPGTRLVRRSELPPRAELLTRTGSVLAEGGPTTGPAGSEVTRASPLGAAADAAIGTLASASGATRTALESEGAPGDALVGRSGLEAAFDGRLRGTPGGTLLDGRTVIARARPRAAPALRTSISAPIQEAAVEALGAQYGGVVVLQPSTGQILAVAGIGLEGLQPPGSTFKMVTVTAALENHVATPRSEFPYSTYATLDGVKLSNSESEDCGGTLTLAFAVSCNSVFAPLGVRIGAHRLVATAERYGFNKPASPSGAATSSLPPAREIQGELAVGSTAIGQDKVLATPLEMGTIAATIGEHGVRPTPTFLLAPSHPAGTASSPGVAREVRSLMEAVVEYGTGTAAAIPGVTVAGKTGTAELGEPCAAAKPHEAEASPCKSSSNTDAWFAAFAPAADPQVAVGVLMVKDGFGGETAAPVARRVIEAALAAHL